MGTTYDEDLLDNAFFQILRKDYNEVFFNAISEGCVLCVPRVGSLSTYTISLDDVLGHVLAPSCEMPESHFNTLNGRDVKISNGVLTVEYELGCHFSTHILFEETYYMEDLHKYKVLCIEHPLEPKGVSQSECIFDIRSLRDCMDMLWLESGNKKIIENLDETVNEFLGSGQLVSNASLQTLKDLCCALYAKCLQIVMKDVRLREKASMNMHTLKNLKLAVETYIQHGIYDKLFNCISANTEHDDSKLNKTVRNSIDLQPVDLQIPVSLFDSIPRARLELGKIDGYSTVLGKLGCLRKMMSVISNDSKQFSMLAADDLLPTVIYIVIKTNVSNWLAQLAFIKQFNFSSNNNSDRQEDEFLVTILEAAIEHIRSGVFLGPAYAEGQYVPLEKTVVAELRDEPSSMSALFQHVSRGNLTEVKKILEKDTHSIDYKALNLCHPLCICDSCHKAIVRSDMNMNPTVHTCNDDGLTVLHIAAMYGQSTIVDYLLTTHADHNSADINGCTPLHHAALRGHQTSLLLLIQNGAEVNAADNSFNTPLHFCCVNGHETCVKALIYNCKNVSEHLVINAQNVNGDTPLHNAAKWGYLPIVQLLLENGANPCIFNRRKASPCDLSTNPKVVETLSRVRPNLKPNDKKVNFDFLDDFTTKKATIIGEKPRSSEQMRKVDKMLKAISNGDTNLACFYLGLDPVQAKNNNCHPLNACLDRNITSEAPISDGTLPINSCNSEGVAALHIAAAHGCVNLTQTLINNGAHLDLQTQAYLATPLMLATQNQRHQIVRILLEANSDINMQDNKGNTALHYAAINGNARVVETLLQYKPELDLKNRNGWTPLQEAENKMALGVANILKEGMNSKLGT